ncbi:uncharacterized protein LOC118666062 isoform X3 [Myotis myotis]|uniref:uncharacterized protein LOC118666062 isoform X3 n=1 Tax=Myotis myotis TaxID=51298 RepID=UPI00174E7118|nr:uncharacterized protein LOC118666062 isoform X3 [Myotis myotis]
MNPSSNYFLLYIPETSVSRLHKVDCVLTAGGYPAGAEQLMASSFTARKVLKAASATQSSLCLQPGRSSKQPALRNQLCVSSLEGPQSSQLYAIISVSPGITCWSSGGKQGQWENVASPILA